MPLEQNAVALAVIDRHPVRIQPGQTIRAARVRQVVFNQVQIGVVLDAQLFNGPEVDGAGPPISAVHGVALVEQELGEVGAVLTCNAGDDCCLAHGYRYLNN